MCCVLEVSPQVEHSLLVRVMEGEEARKKWDDKVSQLKVREEEDGTRVVITKFAQMLVTRTLVEKRVNRFFPNELRVVYYSPGDINLEDSTQAYTYFGFHRFETKGDFTTITLLSQTDYRLPALLLKAMSQVKKEASRWYVNFHAEVTRQRDVQ